MNQLIIIFILCFVLKNKAVEINHNENLLVRTDAGLLMGHVVNTITSDFIAWQGIPYAKPPIGELRFKPPQPIDNWNNILIANTSCDACIQLDGSGSEDCLCVEVFSPIKSICPKVLPVMVWIHGGAFVEGSASLNSTEPESIMRECVVLVFVQYRLGINGFLSLGTAEAPGNNGLKDQVLALKWVKKNIEFFRGDPNRITIFGESAGSASVSYHLLSPMSKGLFNKAIMQSGTSLCQWALTRGSTNFALNLAKMFKINSNNLTEILEGLRNVPPKQLQRAAAVLAGEDIVIGNALDGLPMGPVIEPDVEGAFLTGKAQDMLSKGEFNRVPTIIGHNSLEALSAFNSKNLLLTYVQRYEFNNAELTPISMNATPINKYIAGKMIYNKYFGKGPMSMNNLPEFISMDQFNKCIIKTIQLQARYADTYYYVFSHMGQLGLPGVRPHKGVGHAEDVSYIFVNGQTNISYPDLLASRRIIKMWTNFATHGNPTPKFELILQGIRWPKVSSSLLLPYLNINNTMNVALKNLDDIFFYDLLYEFFGRSPFNCY